MIQIQWQTASIYPTVKILEERTVLITLQQLISQLKGEGILLKKKSKYAYGSIPLSRYMSYNKGFHAPALMEGSILWRSTSWSCPNLSSQTTNHQKNEANQKNNKTKNREWEWEWESKPSIPIYDLSYFWSKFFNLQ